MLNPIEEFFSKLKMMVRRLPSSNEQELIYAIQTKLLKFSAKDLRGYIRHTLSFVEDSLLKIDFL